MNTKIIFSIIIPTYNRPEKLTSCLEAIANLNYESDLFEVIVIDDGSKIPLDDAVALFKDKVNIRLSRQENAGPATARNRGAALAQGKFLAFTDDDCQPTPNWLDKFASGFAKNSEAMIGGKTINALNNNPFSTASHKLIDYVYDCCNTAEGKDVFFTSSNIAMPAASFKALNGFDVSFPLAAAEDGDFCNRWNQVYPTVYAPKAQVYHYHNLNLATFWKQHFSYGRGKFHFHKIRALRNAEKIKIQPLSFNFNQLFYSFSQTTKQPKLLIFSLCFLSRIANATGYFWGWYNESVELEASRK